MQREREPCLYLSLVVGDGENGGFGYIVVFCFYLQTVFVGIHVEPQDHCTHTSWKV